MGGYRNESGNDFGSGDGHAHLAGHPDMDQVQQSCMEQQDHDGDLEKSLIKHGKSARSMGQGKCP